MLSPWILIVDCNDFDASVVLRVLRAEGLEQATRLCVSAGDAVDLLSKAATPPSLVLVESRLPGMTGHDLLEWIRSQGGLKHVPVVFFSGDDRSSVIGRALEGGANSYIAKRTDYDRMVDDLKATVHYWLRVHAGPQSGVPLESSC